MWRWPWSKRRDDMESASKLSEAEARLRQALRDTPEIQRAAKSIADLPHDEFADLVIQAFRRRRRT